MVVSIASFVLGASVIIFLYNIITSWARGPIAGSNPWRAMTIEWQVSSPPPVFNFDEIPQVVGGPYEYGVPGARHAVLKGGALQETPRVSGPRPTEARPRRGKRDARRGRAARRCPAARGARARSRAVVIAPVNEPSAGYVVYRNSRRATAGRRVDRMVSALRAAGIPAHGDVFEGGPIAAVEDVLALEDVDELIVSTHPEEKSGWLQEEERARRAPARLAGDRPFEHVVSDVAARSGQSNVLVVANETVLGESLLDRIRRRAAEGPAAFLIVCPQSDPGFGGAPRGRAAAPRRAHDAPREGIEAHGQIAHPDPYTAAMQIVEDERVDEILVSTFPGERSGWLRRDVVERLRKDAGVPVEHVVAAGVTAAPVESGAA